MGIKQELDITAIVGRVKNLMGLGLDDETIISILGITKEEFEEVKSILEE